MKTIAYQKGFSDLVVCTYYNILHEFNTHLAQCFFNTIHHLQPLAGQTWPICKPGLFSEPIVALIPNVRNTSH